MAVMRQRVIRHWNSLFTSRLTSSKSTTRTRSELNENDNDTDCANNADDRPRRVHRGGPGRGVKIK